MPKHGEAFLSPDGKMTKPKPFVDNGQQFVYRGLFFGRHPHVERTGEMHGIHRVIPSEMQTVVTPTAWCLNGQFFVITTIEGPFIELHELFDNIEGVKVGGLKCRA